MKSFIRTPLFGILAMLGTYLLSWRCNASGFTSISSVTVWGLLASILFCGTWCAIVLLHRKEKLLLWVSVLITLCSLLIYAINTIGLDGYLHLNGISYACAIFCYMPYLGFGLLSEVGYIFVIGLQCLLFLALLVYESKKTPD